MNDNTRIAIALISGIAAGAVFGILFAPGKGTDTRNQISESAGEIAELLKDKLEFGVEAVKTIKNKLYEKAPELETAAATGFKTDIQKNF